MHGLKSLLILTTLLPLLQGCETRQTEPLAAAAPRATDRAARQAEINRQLAARCPTPGRLTPDELRAVAGDLEKGMARHWNRVAGEYDRLDDESRACRGK